MRAYGFALKTGFLFLSLTTCISNASWAQENDRQIFRTEFINVGNCSDPVEYTKDLTTYSGLKYCYARSELIAHVCKSISMLFTVAYSVEDRNKKYPYYSAAYDCSDPEARRKALEDALDSCESDRSVKKSQRVSLKDSKCN